MKVGLCLAQAPQDGAGGTWREILGMARLAEDGGADSLWVSDHFLYRPKDGGDETGYHEAWSLVSAVAASTSRVQIGTLVLATSFRPPGITAKMAATADDVAGGRLILGLGCGWHEPEYLAFGYPFDHRVGRFEEALEIIVRLLHGERLTFHGEWNDLEDAVVLPPPAHRTPILVASTRPRMMAATVRFADAWQTAWYGRPDGDWPKEHGDIQAACEAAGRDPATLEVFVGLTAGAEDSNEPHLELDPAAIADGLAEWAAAGVAHVQLGVFPTTPPAWETVLEGIRRFRGA
jgi:alkanesulfonate monooxygenase SsuD/methylene tetrahydromethanopterin reductase-like flavin-dependent oxidoreductase (luciferase family)